jgi:hypothetical protein
MQRTKQRSWYARLEGYFLIPHELLHVLGYWLVGIECKYHWGEPYVIPLGEKTGRKRLVGLLLPFVVFTLILLISAVISGFAFAWFKHGSSPFWFAFWVGASLLAGVYAGSAIFDLRDAYLLIYDKPWYSWTPFDLFFWPIIDWWKVRENLEADQETTDV